MFKSGLIGIAAATSILFAAAMGIAADSSEEGEQEDNKFNYTVEEGNRVDESTMMGYSVYTGSCMACHGPDGLGSSFAPSLVRAVERRTFEVFAETIAGGLSLQPSMVMPSFAEDMRVMSHIEDIWNYLGARAEGGLGRGRPQPIAAENDDAGAEGDGG